MRYAEVCVNSPLARRQTFSYAIPPDLTVNVGQALLVPFGEKLLQGIVMELSDAPAVPETREIAGIIEPQPLLSPAHVALAEWLSQYYLSPLFDAVALLLPPGFERKALTFISARDANDADRSSLTAEQSRALGLVPQAGKINLREIEKTLGQQKARRLVAQLVKHSLVTRSYELEPVRIRPRQELYVNLSVDAATAHREAGRLRDRRAVKQAALLEFLAEQSPGIPWNEVRQKVQTSKATLDALAQKKLVTVEQRAVRRDPLSRQAVTPSYPLPLSAAQAAAFQPIQHRLAQPAREDRAVFLLHGVTGSGKTEVYLQALAETVRQGKRGIVLVPEIALTPQTIERFAARFPGRVAVLHSQLSAGEQFDEWHRIRHGAVDVVIGARSALFAPQPDLGLIVIDEEHEWSYKQDISPRYHARQVALKLAGLTGAVVILGSATPDVESFYRAQQNEYHLLSLPERVTPRQNAPLPGVEIVDLRDELKSGNRSIFSRALAQAVAETIARREQVILFLNRRGAATFVQCRNCGFVLSCRRCAVALTHHSERDTLVCHQCNYQIPAPKSCPRCRSRQIKFLGIGTQRVAQEVGNAFPQARVLRWDSDTTRQKYAHQEILNRFRNHQADILIGTQMIAKGLDLPQVTLVGIINADTGLNLPEFRAGERTFQLLSQVAGRAGRGPAAGRVIIQTYSPEHYAIQAAARHDYSLFYHREIDYRRQLRHPPFNRLASLVFNHASDSFCQREAERMKRQLLEARDTRGIADLSLIGPAPAFIHRLRGRFRWQLMLRHSEAAAFLATMPIPRGWVIDIDPLGL